MAVSTLRSSQIETLQTIVDHPGGYVRVVELAEMQGIQKAAAERKLNALVASGHLRRATGRDGKVYVITDAGRDALFNHILTLQAAQLRRA